jgi:uncharacterized phage protein (TIGR01671 family)
MNREIKFRGKRIDTEEWVYGDLLHINQSSYIKSENAHCRIIGIYGLSEFGEIEQENAEDWICEVIPETIGQYIGLPDKNGREIYEGDRVREVFGEGEVPTDI